MVVGSDQVRVVESVRELYGVGVVLGIYTDRDVVRCVLGVRTRSASIMSEVFRERVGTYGDGYNTLHSFETQDPLPQRVQLCMENRSDIGP